MSNRWFSLLFVVVATDLGWFTRIVWGPVWPRLGVRHGLGRIPAAVRRPAVVDAAAGAARRGAHGGVPVSNDFGPPPVRCGICGRRCRWFGKCSVYCRHCSWQSADWRRTGWRWRLRVWIGR